VTTPTRLGAFVLGLAAVFAGALGAGRLAGPVAAEAVPDRGATHSGQGEAAGDQAVVAAPGGLQVAERGYSLRLAAPTAPAGRSTLAFTVVGRDDRPVTAYQVTHEKELHLIVVQRDLSGYQHLHPVRDEAGTWSTPADLRPGTYRVFADFQPLGEAAGLTLGADLIVSGTARPGLLPAPSGSDFVDDYEVTIHGELRAGAASRLAFKVRRHGRVVTDLQPYLGAAGHLVALRAGDLAYLHVHPVGNGLAFDAEVPSSGTYRLYLDFKHGDTVRTAEFTAVASAAPPSPTPAATSGGPGGHGG